jgi:CheY-like chemotaxis protein
LKAAARGAKLTAQLLAFSRLQAIDLQPVHVTDLVAGMADLLLMTLGTQVDIEYCLDKTSISVLADKTQLELALLNLAINARDAMPGGGQLRISTKLFTVDNDPELACGEYLELSVADTGGGMLDAVRSRAFDPFFTTKRAGEGTGLGLAQVYGIARQAGGTARIISSMGTGTTVTLYLRLVTIPVVALNDIEEESIIKEEKISSKILVVDDEDDIRFILGECLTVLGYDVSEASDGFSALKMMAVSLPDILVTDYLMPKINGAEFVKLARANGYNMPVIFASGYSNTEALNEAVGFKANVLVKPFSVQTLVQAIETALLDR